MQTNSALRFGAYLGINYHANIPNSQLDLGKKLNNARTTVEDRVKAIEDKKDPLNMQVTVTNDNYQGTIATNNNGYHTIKPEEKETPASFMNRLVSKAEELAKSLMTSEERNTSKIRTADEFLRPVLLAVLSGNAKFKSSSEMKDASAAMHGTTGRYATIEIGGQEYSLRKTLRGQTTSFSISTKGDKPETTKSFGISYNPSQGYSDVRYSDDKFEADFNEIARYSNFEKPVLALAQRGKQLLTELESRNAFTTISLDPII